jgi:hypothetical protein
MIIDAPGLRRSTIRWVPMFGKLRSIFSPGWSVGHTPEAAPARIGV